MPPITWSDGLALAAQDQCESHPTEINLLGLIEKYGEIPHHAPDLAIDIAGGPGKGVKQILMLFVGEDLHSDDYRGNLLSEFYTQTGMHYCEKIKGLVIIFADGFRVNDVGKKQVKKSLWISKNEKDDRSVPKMMLESPFDYNEPVVSKAEISSYEP